MQPLPLPLVSHIIAACICATIFAAPYAPYTYRAYLSAIFATYSGLHAYAEHEFGTFFPGFLDGVSHVLYPFICTLRSLYTHMLHFNMFEY